MTGAAFAGTELSESVNRVRTRSRKTRVGARAL